MAVRMIPVGAIRRLTISSRWVETRFWYCVEQEVVERTVLEHRHLTTFKFAICKALPITDFPCLSPPSVYARM